MKKVLVNAIKLHCSVGRIEKGETAILPDEEVTKINKLRPHVITVVEDVVEKPAKKAPAKRKRARNTNGTLKSDDPSTPDINEAWEE